MEYASLPQIYFSEADRSYYRRMAEKLNFPFNYIALLDVAVIGKVAQHECFIRSWTCFPFCCITGECVRPLRKIPSHPPGPCARERFDPCFTGHTCINPEEWVYNCSQGVVDIPARRSNNFPQCLDRTNVIYDIIVSGLQEARLPKCRLMYKIFWSQEHQTKITILSENLQLSLISHLQPFKLSQRHNIRDLQLTHCSTSSSH